MSNVKEIINSMRAEVVEGFIESIEQDELSWAVPWQAGLRAVNGFTGRAYTGRNRLHLAYAAYLKGYTDNRWTTFKAAAQHGMRRAGARCTR